MWYVNFKIKKKPFSFLISFILTMWYVNASLNPIAVISDSGFILTMWYVNKYKIKECSNI